MRGELLKSLLVLISLVFILNFVSAAPQLTIHSPQNITYNATKVSINVTSNEPVDFYTKSPRTNILLKSNSTFYESVLYGKTGNFRRTIYANNSNGETNATAYFSINASNPINITECGALVSPNAQYRVINNLSGACLNWNEDANNISLDLNGFTIKGSFSPISAACFFSEVFNGTLNKTTELGLGALDLQGGNSCSFKDIKMESISYGITAYIANEMFFERVNITAPVGLLIDNSGSVGMNFKNVNFVGSRNGLGESVFWHFDSTSDVITLENVTFTNYTKHVDVENNFQMEYIVRNSPLNYSNVIPPYGFSRFIIQHLALITLTDILGNPISGAIEVVDENFNVSSPPPIKKINSNPTEHVFAGTNASGVAEVFLTGKIDVKRTFSPTEEDTVTFNSYNLTARSKGLAEQVSINFNSTNSTIPVNISIDFSSEELSQCTIAQMLDLNNNGNVDISDVVIVMRKVAGLSISVQTERKGCEGINLGPF